MFLYKRGADNLEYDVQYSRYFHGGLPPCDGENPQKITHRKVCRVCICACMVQVHTCAVPGTYMYAKIIYAFNFLCNE